MLRAVCIAAALAGGCLISTGLEAAQVVTGAVTSDKVGRSAVVLDGATVASGQSLSIRSAEKVVLRPGVRIEANATVRLGITAIAVPDRYQTGEGQSQSWSVADGVLSNDRFPVGATGSAVLVSGPQQAAQFSLQADGSLAYEPAAGFTGVDSFDYVVDLGAGVTSPATTVTIAVGAFDSIAENSTLGWGSDSAPGSGIRAPGRIWTPAPGAQGTMTLRAVGSRFLTASSGSVMLTVEGSDGASTVSDVPVTFQIMGQGLFANGQNTWSSPGAGAAASVQLTGLTFGRTTVLASSPSASGIVRFVISAE